MITISESSTYISYIRRILKNGTTQRHLNLCLKIVDKLLKILKNEVGIYETTETTVNISDRKDITELIARNATTIYCNNCISLTKLDLPVATTVNCWGCISLTKLDLPVATTVYRGGCTNLKKKNIVSNHYCVVVE